MAFKAARTFFPALVREAALPISLPTRLALFTPALISRPRRLKLRPVCRTSRFTLRPAFFSACFNVVMVQILIHTMSGKPNTHTDEELLQAFFKVFPSTKRLAGDSPVFRQMLVTQIKDDIAAGRFKLPK